MTDDEIFAKGFKPFHGNERPADFDDSKSVLFGNGFEVEGDREWCWSLERHPSDTIIGYHPKEATKPTRIVIPDGPAPEWAQRRADKIWAEDGCGGVLSFAAHLIAMLEQPPVDPVESAAADMAKKWHHEVSPTATLAEYFAEAIRIGQEMGKGEV